jgi:hypothetical protein
MASASDPQVLAKAAAAGFTLITAGRGDFGRELALTSAVELSVGRVGVEPTSDYEFQIHPKEVASRDYGVQLNHSACYRSIRAGEFMDRSIDKSAQRLRGAGRPVASHRLLAGVAPRPL